MFKNILVPLDSSEASFRALSHAADLAKAARGKITLLSAIDLSGSFSTSYMDEQEEFLRKEFARVHKKAVALCRRKKVRVHSKILLGNPSSEIRSFVKKNKVDLVVIGRTGAGLKRKIEKAILGSVSKKIVESCPCAVLVTH